MDKHLAESALTDAERGALSEALICRGDVYAAVERIIAARMAEAWDQGRAAERRDWEFTFDLVTPDEDRQPWPNPYRYPPGVTNGE